MRPTSRSAAASSFWRWYAASLRGSWLGPHGPGGHGGRHDSGISVVAAPNFSVGVQIFLALARRAGAMFAERPELGAYIHEHHHALKADAPSGTARELEAVLDEIYSKLVHVKSEVGPDGPEIVMALGRAIDRGRGHGRIDQERGVGGVRRDPDGRGSTEDGAGAVRPRRTGIDPGHA